MIGDFIMYNDLINEEFVQELLKSGVWDITRQRPVDEKKDTGASKGDKGKDKDDPESEDYEGEERKGDKSKTKKGKKDYEKADEGVTAKDLAADLYENLSEDVIFEFVSLVNSLIEENSAEEDTRDAKEIARDILLSVDEDVTLEIIDLLYKTVNEAECPDDNGDDDDDDEDEEGDEDEKKKKPFEKNGKAKALAAKFGKK